MKIAIDVSSSAKKEKGGVANYIVHLVRGLAEIDEHNQYYLCYRLSRWKRREFFLTVERPNFSIRMLQEPFSLLTLRGIDIFHGLDARLPRFFKAKLIPTIHDLFALESDEFASESFRQLKARRYGELVRKATAIVSVSQSTKDALVEYLKVPEERVVVIHEGVDEKFSPRDEEERREVLEKYRLKGDYLLHVGGITRRKNTQRLVRAFWHLQNRLKRPLQLALIGRLGFGHQETLEAIESLGLGEKVKLLGYVDNSDLPCLYSGARVFVFPSLSEGFGLPVLEAMACGIPVMTSNLSSMPEVAGDAALLVNPRDEDEMAQAMHRLLTDEALRSQLIHKGLERVKLFSWKETARKTLALYEKIGNR